MSRVLLELHDGRVAGALLENGLLDHLAGAGAEVLMVTPAATVPWFVERHARDGVELTRLPARGKLSTTEVVHERLDRSLGGLGLHGLRRGLWRWASRGPVARRAVRERQLVRDWAPDVVVATHVIHPFCRDLVAAAQRADVPTVGNLFSWDNAYRGLKIRPDRMTCWSERNRRELCGRWAYRDDEVVAVGAPAFDAYLAEGAAWSREELAGRLGLDPERPILLWATLGEFRKDIDETGPLDAFLAAIDRGAVPGRPQIVLRLHPASRAHYFTVHAARPDLLLSRYVGYVPGLGWYPTREEMVLAGNLFRHADVCISPGSTVTLEAALFDTPTVVPVFNPYMPEEYARFFASNWLERHFRPLIEQDLLELCRSAEELVAQVIRALADPGAGRDARRTIRAQYLEPLDGRATERLARAVLDTAEARA